MSKPFIGWSHLLKEEQLFSEIHPFPISAYSEFMPGPFVGVKPYFWSTKEVDSWVLSQKKGYLFGISEYEEAFQLRPGMLLLAKQLTLALKKLVQGQSIFSPHLLKNNPYWPENLATQAQERFLKEKFILLLPLALSKTLDDKGRIRWTLFGASEQGPAQPFWQSFRCGTESSEQGKERAIAFLRNLFSLTYQISEKLLNNLSDFKRIGLRILPVLSKDSLSSTLDRDRKFEFQEDLPNWADELIMNEAESIGNIKYILTFRPFAYLPSSVQTAYLQGKLQLIPFPGSLIFWGHSGYHTLSKMLPGAIQIPLLHSLTSRHSAPFGLRVLQAGWIHEPYSNQERIFTEAEHGPVLNQVQRTHRFSRIKQEQDEVSLRTLHEKISRALFDNSPDVLGLYGKPMAKNAQLWTHDYRLLLNGPEDSRERLEEATHCVDTGGQFGYRFFFPPMRVGNHELFWHRPLCSFSSSLEELEPSVIFSAANGYLTASLKSGAKQHQEESVLLWPEFLQREAHLEAISLFENRVERQKYKTTFNIRKLLQAHEQLGELLEPSFACSLVTMTSQKTFEEWLTSLPTRTSEQERGSHLVEVLRGLLKQPSNEPSQEQVSKQSSEFGLLSIQESSLTFEKTRSREFEEKYFQTIAKLAQGRFIHKDNADIVGMKENTNEKRDLEALGDFLHEQYHELMTRHKMVGKAMTADHIFRWRTHFDFPWSEGWSRNQMGTAWERNIVLIIPGQNRQEAVIMADHYDTAYMEDVYEKESDARKKRRASAGADDNHSATATLLLAADVFLSLSKAGLLKRDIWLIHLTGEEFPADCLGARHLVQRLVEKNFVVVSEKEGRIDLSDVQIQGAFILDMVAHHHDQSSYVFQISPGEGAKSMQLAYQAHQCNKRWNQLISLWNQSDERKQKGPSLRTEHAVPPAIVEYPKMRGEVRPNWHSTSSLYNTDAQIFSDAGIPVVLFMEDYDINRAGYHDTQDTLQNIDLDYGAALAAIAIETVAQVATNEE